MTSRTKAIFKLTLVTLLVLSVTVSLSSCFLWDMLFGKEHEHTYGEWRTTVSAGCLNEGERVKTCTICGDTRIEVIPSLGHSGKSETVKATCTEGGYTLYSCDTCKIDYVADELPPLGHSYGQWQVREMASCTEHGTDFRVCANCFSEDMRVVKASGHNYVLNGKSDLNSYECLGCDEVLVTDKSLAELSRDDSYVKDCDVSYSFEILSYGDEEYVRDHLIIYDASYGVDNTGDIVSVADTIPDGVLIDFDLIYKGDGVWEVVPKETYAYSTTYSAFASGDLAFALGTGEEITFKTEKDPHHVNSFDYSDEIIYLNAIGQKYHILDRVSEDYLYIVIEGRYDLKVGDIVCVGRAYNEGDLARDVGESHIGKISYLSPYGSGVTLAALEAPALNEVFTNFDVVYSELMDFSGAEMLPEGTLDEIKDSLYRDEDFKIFLSAVNVTAEDFLTERGFDTSVLAASSFLDNIEITPDAKMEGTKLIATVTGTLEVPIKKGDRQYGRIEVGFEFSITSEFNIDLTYQLRKTIIPTGIDYFDLSITETDTVGFEFHIDIQLDYSISSSSELFVQNTDPKSMIIHCKDCEYVTRIKDTSKLKYLTTEEVHEILDNPAKTGRLCILCKPIEELNRTVFVINDLRDTFHAYNCYHTGRMVGGTVSHDSAEELIEMGLNPCDYCRPQQMTDAEFEDKLLETLMQGDWKTKIDEIRSFMPESDSGAMNETGKTLLHQELPVCSIVSVYFAIDFVFNFSLEASAKYELECSRKAIYGMMLKSGRIEAYSHDLGAEITKNELTVVGRAELQSGLALSIGVGITGLTRYINVTLSVEVGVYSEISGIVRQNFLDNSQNSGNYAAAYFGAGIYVTLDASYRLIKWSGSVSIFEGKIPLLQYGYERAYFAYQNYVESMSIGDGYDIKSGGLLSVSYYDLLEMKELDGESLDINGKEGLYSVEIYLEDGSFAEIIDGVIYVKDNAPCSFTDTLVIRVNGTAEWSDYIKGNSVFYLGDYRINLDVFVREHNNTLIETVESTCDEAGYRKYHCSICDYDSKEEIAPKGHVGGTADCDSRAVCTVCEKPYGAILGHDYVDGFCTRCKQEIYTRGLILELSADESYYIVTGLSSASGKLIIPGVYDGKPVKEIADKAFYELTHITDVRIGNGVLKIGNNAFEHCSSIVSLTLSDSITHIGKYAFSGCKAMKKVYFGDGLRELGEYCFYLVELDEMHIKDLAKWCAVYFKGSGYNPIPDTKGLYVGGKYPANIVIPEGVTKINKWAFFGVPYSTVDLPESLTYMHANSFGGKIVSDGIVYVDNWVQYGYASITSANLREGTVGIADEAFINNDSLRYVTLPSSVIYCGYDAFYGCDNINSLYISDLRNYLNLGVAIIRNTDYENMDKIYLNGSELSGRVVIPDGVKSLAASALSGCDKITELILPEGLTSIGSHAFYTCSSLEYISFPSTLSYVGTDAFMNCYSIRYLEFADIAAWCKVYFADFDDDMNFTYPLGWNVASIFYLNGEEIKTLVIPDGVEKIPDRAFRGNLTAVILPKSVTSIGEYAFDGGETVYYMGTEADRANIDSKTSLWWYYYSETKPEKSGYYWHFDENGNPVKW